MVGELIKQLNYVIKDPGFFHFFFLSSSIYWLFVPNLLPHIHKMVATTPGISLHKTIFKGRKKEMAKVAKNNSPFMLLSGPPPKISAKFHIMGHMATPIPITVKGNRIHPIGLGQLLPLQN